MNNQEQNHDSFHIQREEREDELVRKGLCFRCCPLFYMPTQMNEMTAQMNEMAQAMDRMAQAMDRMAGVDGVGSVEVVDKVPGVGVVDGVNNEEKVEVGKGGVEAVGQAQGAMRFRR